mmetsp:Transcript_21784/g.50266  ORF Transcript_21784/g.50266 Transcript_21784/m.50266 type:complete len:98 (+) Transcript_21784:1418-1711(+)
MFLRVQFCMKVLNMDHGEQQWGVSEKMVTPYQIRSNLSCHRSSLVTISVGHFFFGFFVLGDGCVSRNVSPSLSSQVVDDMIFTLSGLTSWVLAVALV